MSVTYTAILNLALPDDDTLDWGPYWRGNMTKLEAGVVAPQTHAAASKVVPASADELFICDSAAAYGPKKLTWENLVAALQTISLYGGVFVKSDYSSVVFTRTGIGTVSIKAGTIVSVAGVIVPFATDTAVSMCALSSGTDYAIYVCSDGSLRADASFSYPSGYSVLNSRLIGGFHFAPGSCATGHIGGNTTPQINPYSLYDLKFRPACPDPRGMALVAGTFWADIYLLGLDHYTNGSSKFNVTIADYGNPPKRPSLFDGNGTLTYTHMNWFDSRDILLSYGKRLPRYSEFSALAFGSTENSSLGADPVTTAWAAAYVSKWGINQATGCQAIFGAEFGGGAADASWVDVGVGRGYTYQISNIVIFGGDWSDTTHSGSLCSSWNNYPTTSTDKICARGVCDHLMIHS